MSTKEVERQKSMIRMSKMTEQALADDQISEFKEAFEMFSGGKPAIAKADARQLFKQYGELVPPF